MRLFASNNFTFLTAANKTEMLKLYRNRDVLLGRHFFHGIGYRKYLKWINFNSILLRRK